MTAFQAIVRNAQRADLMLFLQREDITQEQRERALRMLAELS